MPTTILRESMIPDIQNLKQVLYTSGAYERFGNFLIEECSKVFRVPPCNVTLDTNTLQLHIVHHSLIDRDKIIENMAIILRAFIDNAWVNGIDVDRYINLYEMMYNIILHNENDIIIKL